MPTLYVETSALLRVALEGDLVLKQRLIEADRSMTSALTRVEADRAFRCALSAKRLQAGTSQERRRWVEDFLSNTRCTWRPCSLGVGRRTV